MLKLLAILGLVAIGTNALRVAQKKHGGDKDSFIFDESTVGNVCWHDYQCDGNRKCNLISELCQGTAR
jgi:hypothetical protein